MHDPKSRRHELRAAGQTAPGGEPGEFTFAAAYLEHGHIYGQCNGLLEAGAELKWVYDPDEKKVAAFRAKYPQASPRDRSTRFWLTPASTCGRGAPSRSSAGPRPSCHGRPAKIILPTRRRSRRWTSSICQTAVARTKTAKVHGVFFRAPARRGRDVRDRPRRGRCDWTGDSGTRSRTPSARARPTVRHWFFERAKYGGILCDIGSHQFEQFLTYTGATDATVEQRRSEISRIPTNRNSRTSAKPRCSATTAPRTTSGSTGSPRRPQHLGRWAHGYPRHEGLHRTAQIRRRRPRQAGDMSTLSTSWRTPPQRRRQGRVSVFWRADSRLPEPHRKGDDPGPRVQGGRALPARATRGAKIA